MKISFDPAKDATNVQKHGVSLLLAEKIRWDEVWCAPDTRMDYGELREIGFAMVGARLYVVVFVQRADVMRIVSLRKANSREVKLYVESQ